MMAQEDRRAGGSIGETAHCLVPSSPRAHGGRPQKTRASSDLQDKSSNAKRLGAAETANRNQADHADIFSRLLERTAYFRVTLAHGPQTLRSARQVPGIARRNGSAVGNWRRSTIIVSLKSKWPDQAGQRQLASAADANWRMSVAHLPSLKISQSRSCRLRLSYRWR